MKISHSENIHNILSLTKVLHAKYVLKTPQNQANTPNGQTSHIDTSQKGYK